MHVVAADLDAAARDYHAKMDMVNQYVRHAQLPRALRSKLRSFYALVYPGKRSFDEEAILSELSPPLRQAVRLERYGHVLDLLHVVHVGSDPGLPGAIAQALESSCYVEGDGLAAADATYAQNCLTLLFLDESVGSCVVPLWVEWLRDEWIAKSM